MWMETSTTREGAAVDQSLQQYFKRAVIQSNLKKAPTEWGIFNLVWGIQIGWC